MVTSHEQLRGWAKGMYTLQAATELLIRAFDGRFAQPGQPWIVTAAEDAWIDFLSIPDNIVALSSGEQKVLMIAASLGADNAGVPICLDQTLTGLDHYHTRLVLSALAHAAGHFDGEYLLPWPEEHERKHNHP